MKELNNAVALFEQKEVRRVWHEDAWWFSVADIVEILSDSKDIRQYVKKMRSRDPELESKWGTICTPLEMTTKDAKRRLVMCANTESCLRIIQSIPSPKAEPFKLWLAQVGRERIEEINNPALAMERMRMLYEQKGYSQEWIEKRLRGIAVRNDLTKEWGERGAEGSDYAILTNDIMHAAFGMTVGEYKAHKDLEKPNELRDHMTDMELILTMLGEATTTELTQTRGTRGTPKLRVDAKDGGGVAGKARKNIEQLTGKKVSKKINYLKQKEADARKMISNAE